MQPPGGWPQPDGVGGSSAIATALSEGEAPTKGLTARLCVYEGPR